MFSKYFDILVWQNTSQQKKSNSRENVFDNVTSSVDHKNKLHTTKKNNYKKKKPLPMGTYVSSPPFSLSLELFS